MNTAQRISRPPRRTAWIAVTVTLFACSVLPGAAVAAATVPARKLDTEAVYLHRLGAFAEWPKEPSTAPLTLCIFDRDPTAISSKLFTLARDQNPAPLKR